VAAVLAIIAVHGQTSGQVSIGQDSAAYLPAGPILTINGDPIDSREFLLQMASNRAQVFQYFYDHYGVQDSASFWTTPHGSITPVTMIKQLTTQQLVRLTVQQQMARARGLVRDITYATMPTNLQRENQRRAAATARGEVVFGLTHFDAWTYFIYVTTNLETNLKQSVEAAMLSPKAVVLTKLYLQRRAQNYACPPPSTGRGQPGIHQPPVRQYCPAGQKYLPYSAVSARVLQQWKDNQFSALVDAQVRTAVVRINHRVYDRVVAQ
jgi:hypothetical protein